MFCIDTIGYAPAWGEGALPPVLKAAFKASRELTSFVIYMCEGGERDLLSDLTFPTGEYLYSQPIDPPELSHTDFLTFTQ